MENNKKYVSYNLPGKRINLNIVSDVEALITDVNDPDKVPCWAEVWPAAQAMALHIWEKIDFRYKEVLELGCGLGLPGVVAGIKGAKITFSDFKIEALNLALENAKLNNVSFADTYFGDWRKFDLNKKFDCIIASDICYDPDLNTHLQKIFTNNLKIGGSLLVSHPKRPETQRLLEDLKSRYVWEETVFNKTIKIQDSLLPYYVIDINQMVLEEANF